MARIAFVALVVFALLVPPWQRSYAGRTHEILGWAPIFAPREPANGHGVGTVAWSVLALEIVAAAVVTFGSAWALGARAAPPRP